MKKSLLFLLLDLWIGSLAAAPISFDTTQFNVDAFAAVGAVVDRRSDSSPPSPLPLFTRAAVATASDIADSVGAAETGSLAASAEADSRVDKAFAEGSARFTGNFTLPGSLLHLLVNYASFIDMQDGGTASARIFLLLVIDGVTVLDQVINAPGAFDRFFVVPVGGLGVLDLLLISNADGNFDGSFGEGSASFRLEIPEAPTVFIFATALLSLLLITRARRVRNIRT
jgi:hypothetical protein